MQRSFEFLVCLSVCQSAYFFTKIMPIQVYILYWMRYLSEIFLRHSQDISRLFTDNFEFLVCLLVGLLFNKIRPIQVYILYWKRYFSENFWRLSLNIFAINPNNDEFLVSLSVCQLAHFFTDIRLIWGYLQFWMIHISEIF